MKINEAEAKVIFNIARRLLCHEYLTYDMMAVLKKIFKEFPQLEQYYWTLLEELKNDL